MSNSLRTCEWPAYKPEHTLKNSETSEFTLLDVIDVMETQGFVCKKKNDGSDTSMSYLVLAFRGTEKNISDWLVNAQCYPKVDGKAKVHSGFLNAFTMCSDSTGKTVAETVKNILDRPDAKDKDGKLLPLFITGHSLGGALALLATKLIAPDVNGACYTFGAPRIGNYDFF